MPGCLGWGCCRCCGVQDSQTRVGCMHLSVSLGRCRCSVRCSLLLLLLLLLLQVEQLARSVLRDPLHVVVGQRNSAQELVAQRLLFVGEGGGQAAGAAAAAEGRSDSRLCWCGPPLPGMQHTSLLQTACRTCCGQQVSACSPLSPPPHYSTGGCCHRACVWWSISRPSNTVTDTARWKHPPYHL